MELRLEPPLRARADRPAVIRLRDDLTIGRHPRPLPPATVCEAGCKYCLQQQFADEILGGVHDNPKFVGLISRMHARVRLDAGGFVLENLSQNQTRVGDQESLKEVFKSSKVGIHRVCL